MKLLSLAVMSVLCALNQALTLSTLTSVTLALFSLNRPVSCFFGIFRRRSSPVQETVISEPESPFNVFNQRMTPAFNRFGFGGSGIFPGFGAPGLGMFGYRFPPQFPPSIPVRAPKPKREVQSGMLPFMPAVSGPTSAQMPPFMPAASAPTSVQMPQQFPSDGASRDPREDVPGLNTDEAESFFTLLAETDENKCISKLICEMGADPESGGEFGKTIAEIIEDLKHFPDGTKVNEYNEIYYIGMIEGRQACLNKFSMCDDESYQLVKNAQADDE